MKVVDLFSGCGGLSVGFAAEGFQILLGADIRSVALRTFTRNFPEALALNQDLRTVSPLDLLNMIRLDPGELDCLVSGPPCQGFSKNVPASQRHLDSPKNLLMLRFLDFVTLLKPKAVLIENVAEIRNAYGQAYTTEIIKTLTDLGYNVMSGRFNAADYGVPQLRRRAFFLANRLEKSCVFPEKTHFPPGAPANLFNWEHPANYVTAWEAIGDLPPVESGGGVSPCEYPEGPLSDYARDMRCDSPLLHDHVARPLAPKQLERVQHLAPGEGAGFDMLPEALRPKMGYSGAYARLFPNEPARTITRWVFHPGSGRYYHPFQDRVITIREAARLQSFPDHFIFEGTYVQKASQVGEAVPPRLASKFARIIKDLLHRSCP